MRPRHAVLLTPLARAVPSSLLISILHSAVTPLESALTTPSQVTENTVTLSPLECALTRLSPATPLECALTKNTGGGGLPGHPVTRHSPPATRRYTQVLSFHTLAHSFALFCTPAKLNSFVFKLFRTLRPKTRGVGVPAPRISSLNRNRSPVLMHCQNTDSP
jgi:hypothetical protein